MDRLAQAQPAGGFQECGHFLAPEESQRHLGKAAVEARSLKLWEMLDSLEVSGQHIGAREALFADQPQLPVTVLVKQSVECRELGISKEM
ncbi:Zonadhesin [Manis pentadactyla]|nr:Zonadhesin [Manis pentadactyla]